jgi:UDP-N-acetyl-D-mannosaminuronic acid dehydrogenase
MKKITIIGGCGHVGLPLGLAFASKGFSVHLLDINQKAVEMINAKKLPFLEEGAQHLLDKHCGRELKATLDPNILTDQDVIVFVTGTPVDEHHNPRIQDVVKVIDIYSKYLNPRQLIVLRSTVFPGVVEVVQNLLAKKRDITKVAFCPERIVQGKGIEEIFQLPQLVSGMTEEAESEALELFSALTKKVILLKPKEAEIAKLMTNSWRYLEFAIANQFYMMVEEQGLDFHKIYRALKEDYPRAKHYARPGLAAGPCLFKDTMQLSAFHNNNFFLGQSAMLVNEGLPAFLIQQLEKKLGDLKNKKIAILGMTFKPNNDDTRESLSFKIKKLLEFKMAEALPSDPYLPETCSLQEALEKADGVILGVPHNEYIHLKISKPFIDCWGVWSST